MLPFDFMDFPTLHTDRLLLREIVAGDADAIFAIRGDYAVTRLNIGAAYTSVDEARDLIESMTRAYQERRALRWGVCIRNGEEVGPVVGMCGFNYWDQTDRRASVGFDLAQACWGRGIMGETLRAVLRFGFVEMNLNRIEADTSADNLPSIRLLERVGFCCEGTQRQQYWEAETGAFADLHLYALLRYEWAATNHGASFKK